MANKYFQYVERRRHGVGGLGDMSLSLVSLQGNLSIRPNLSRNVLGGGRFLERYNSL